MRFLKKKIALSNSQHGSNGPYTFSRGSQYSSSIKESRDFHGDNLSDQQIRSFSPTKETRSKSNLSTKNVAKNYGRAICNFILSDLSQPYLTFLPEIQQFDLGQFQRYIHEKRSTLTGMKDIKALVQPDIDDDMILISYKKVFQKLAIIFLKYFSVNWIFSGKLVYKLEYLKYRSKLLRKIKNPNNFTLSL